ncbi:MAG: hypothetical protein JWN80_854 [Microbacteriaceae bacterium]|nr:hypothetical protein [Microbacteriaceae bacterium]
MITWFAFVQIGIAALGGVLCLVLGFAGRKPNDYSLGSAALVELLLVVQLVIAIVAPFAGNHSTGNPLEFYIYLVSALIMVPLAVFWALVQRDRWSTVVVGVANLAIAVMVFRMYEIWCLGIA